MVKKSPQHSPPPPRRGGRRSRAQWAALRSAYEDGVKVELLAQASGLDPDTIHRRADDEHWTTPHQMLERLSQGVSATLSKAEAALVHGDVNEAERAIKLVDALMRAVERLCGLRRAYASDHAQMREGDDGPTDQVADFAKQRAALERKLARLARAHDEARDPRRAG